MPRSALIGALLIACGGVATIGGSHHLAKVGQNSVLRAHAEATADQWVSYIERAVPELSEIASGAPLSGNAWMFFAHGMDTSAVIGYRLYDKHGELLSAGGAPSEDAFHVRLSEAGVLAVLKSGEPRLEMDMDKPAHDHVSAGHDHAEPDIEASAQDQGEKHALSTGEHPAPRSGQKTMVAHHAHDEMAHDHASGGSAAKPHTMPILPVAKGGHITSYFHPISADNGLVGVLEIELDHNAIASSLASAFRNLSIGLALVLALAVAPPLLFGWHKAIERRRAERTARYLAFHDPLTHLPNRRYAHEEIERRLQATVTSDETMALLSLDLDGFKAINDTFGHAAGDELLRQTTGRLTALLRSGDLLARPGGDEFLILPKLGATCEAVERLAAEIIESLCKPFDIDGQDASIGASIGIVFADKTWRDRDQLLRAGDVALYEAKMKGRRQAIVFEFSMEERLRLRRETENDLRLAIERDEFILHYQPQFDVKTMTLTGFEALVRWQHPTRGLLPPAEFIQIAENLKLIDTISRWVMHRACFDAVSWSRPLKIAVNVSAVEFEDSNLLATISDALAASGLDPVRLEIELTETVLMGNTDVVIETLNSIRDLGVSVAMDDFGTGYSSLGYLCKFPFDKLKIDRSFLISSDRPKQAQRIVEAVITLGRSLDLHVVAEGVEDADQLTMLNKLACDEAQGFHLGRPMPAEQAKDLVTEQIEQQAATDRHFEDRCSIERNNPAFQEF